MKNASGGVSPPATLTVNITTDQTNYNLFTAAGSPGTAKTVVVNISSGVYIRASSTGNNAFDEGNGWATGTTITINNSGNIIGMGGAGGAGGNQLYTDLPVAGNNGSAGGTALRLTAPTSIANASGAIFGGGGGGGGGSGCYARGDDGESSVLVTSGGGGGGGGRGANTASAGSGGTATNIDPAQKASGAAGTAGSFSGTGVKGEGGNLAFYWYYNRTLSGADGGNGGEFGAAGNNATDPSLTSYSGVDFSYKTLATGGAAGRSVNTNGQSLTWLSGNVPSRVKGPQY